MRICIIFCGTLSRCTPAFSCRNKKHAFVLCTSISWDVTCCQQSEGTLHPQQHSRTWYGMKWKSYTSLSCPKWMNVYSYLVVICAGCSWLFTSISNKNYNVTFHFAAGKSWHLFSIFNYMVHSNRQTSCHQWQAWPAGARLSCSCVLFHLFFPVHSDTTPGHENFRQLRCLLL